MSGPLRVGVNLCWLVPGVVGGSEDYLIGALGALADAAPSDLDVTVFGLAALAEAHPGLARSFPLVTVPLAGRLRALRVGAESTWLAAQLARHRIDVVHHAGGVTPIFARGRTVLTVHDLQPFDLPENFTRAKRAYLAAMVPRSVRAADVITVATRFVEGTIADRFAIGEERFSHLPPCVEAASRPAPSPAAIAAARSRHGVGARYVLYPAITYPHKNHRVLVEALAGLGGAAGEVELVLTGGPAGAEADLVGLVGALNLEGRVRRLGRVPRADLDALLAGAAGLVFPSTYEGFGLPVLEAMAAGVPVAAADIPALAEVVGEGGALVGPHDVAGWAAAIGRLTTDDRFRDGLVAAGRARSQGFGPARTATALAGAYRAAAGRPEPAAPTGGGGGGR